MEQRDMLRQLLVVLDQLGVPYMLVGSIASAVYGEPRMTKDIDVVADLLGLTARRQKIVFPALSDRADEASKQTEESGRRCMARQNS